MEWNDEAIVLSMRRHGESAAIVHLLTRDHGRTAGLVRGASGRELRGVLQPGNEVEAWWKARLADHLGHLRCELRAAHAAAVLGDGGRLACLASACALADVALPEREPNPGVHETLGDLLRTLAKPGWAARYAYWELRLLEELGYGLDLAKCAVTGLQSDLIYVSPRSGRAVSAAAGAPYRDRLLGLPGFLLTGETASDGEISNALALTGYFLERHVFAPQNALMPAARQRLVDRFGA
ncbi:MAG: DNA repair protein RecO [Rhodospirillales bacterium]|nr:DNA repair protein RecO [Rhodospirillales bacterium]